MRSRSLLFSSLAASMAFGLAACTSGEEPGTGQPIDEQPTDEATDGQDEDASATQGPSGNGYLCQFVSPSDQRAVAGGDLAEPQQVLVEDTPEAWVCEARDGDEGMIRVSYLPGDEQRQEHREMVAGLEGVSEGPDWLGESFVSPRMVVGLTLCTDPEATESGERVPFTIVAEAVNESDEDVSQGLTNVATATARALDQGIGCSPRAARDQAEQTQAG